MTVQLITKAAYARHRGCDEKAVRKAIAEGRISAIGGKIDPAVADIQWERNTRARVRPTQPSQADLAPGTDVGMAAAAGAAAGPAVDAPDRPAADPGYMQFRARREEADAQIAEMNAAKMRGAMLIREDVDRAMFEIGRELRDRLTACARRVAAEVASIQTAEGCEAVIDREHRIVLELLVTHFREKIGAPAKGGS
jgi:hypothetical protein